VRLTRVTLEGGERLYAHPADACFNPTACTIHNPTNHHMRHFPQHWRGDRGFMERTCPHGIGHPDPDQMSYIEGTRGERAAYYEGIHGCDGCCAHFPVKIVDIRQEHLVFQVNNEGVAAQMQLGHVTDVSITVVETGPNAPASYWHGAGCEEDDRG
jgi:hypothetical protein